MLRRTLHTAYRADANGSVGVTQKRLMITRGCKLNPFHITITPLSSVIPRLSPSSTIMNAGYGVGNVIAVSTLAWSVYKSCKDAPQQFHEISGEVSRLHIILKETGEVLTDLNEGLKPSKEAQLRELTTGCQEVLTDLEKLLSKFRSLGSRSRRTFDRLRWSQGDVTTLRDRIVSNTTLLGTFCTTVQMCVLPVCEGILLTYK